MGFWTFLELWTKSLLSSGNCWKIWDPFGPSIDQMVVTAGFLSFFCVFLALQMSVLSSETRFSEHFPRIFQAVSQDFRCRVDFGRWVPAGEPTWSRTVSARDPQGAPG